MRGISPVKNAFRIFFTYKMLAFARHIQYICSIVITFKLFEKWIRY